MHWTTLILLFLGCVVLGLASGILSGLLGAGGGLIVVPGLAFLLRFSTIASAIQMHIAIGTSLATMIIVAARSLRSHMKHQTKFFAIYKKMAPGVILGVVSASILAHFIRSHTLSIIFGIFVFVMAYTLFFNKKPTPGVKLPGSLIMLSAGYFVGVMSGLLGVAGSAFSVPFLIKYDTQMRVAVVVSVAIAMTVSIFGTMTYVFTGIDVPNLPRWSTGYVYWPAWIGVVIGGMISAPFGAKWSYLVSDAKLKRYFAIFLLFVGTEMLWP